MAVAVAVIVIVVMIVTGMIVRCRFSVSNLLRGRCLGLGIQVLDLGFAEDAVERSVAVRNRAHKVSYIQVLLEGDL